MLMEVAIAFFPSSHSKNMSAGMMRNPAPAQTSPVINPTTPPLSQVRKIFPWVEYVFFAPPRDFFLQIIEQPEANMMKVKRMRR